MSGEGEWEARGRGKEGVTGRPITTSAPLINHTIIEEGNGSALIITVLATLF